MVANNTKHVVLSMHGIPLPVSRNARTSNQATLARIPGGGEAPGRTACVTVRSTEPNTCDAQKLSSSTLGCWSSAASRPDRPGAHMSPTACAKSMLERNVAAEAARRRVGVWPSTAAEAEGSSEVAEEVVGAESVNAELKDARAEPRAASASAVAAMAATSEAEACSMDLSAVVRLCARQKRGKQSKAKQSKAKQSKAAPNTAREAREEQPGQRCVEHHQTKQYPTAKPHIRNK